MNSRDIILGMTIEASIFSRFLHNFKTFNVHFKSSKQKEHI